MVEHSPKILAIKEKATTTTITLSGDLTGLNFGRTGFLQTLHSRIHKLSQTIKTIFSQKH